MFLLPPSETRYLYDDLIFQYISSSLDSYAFYLKNKNVSLVIKTEQMNNEPESKIRELTNFLDIEITDKIYTSTFLGQDKSSQSARGLRGFDKKINAERWQGELSNFVVTFLELLHYDYMKEFGYSLKIVVNKDKLLRLEGNVLRGLIRVPSSMRRIMLKKAKNDARLDTGKHFHPRLRKIEIFLRLLRMYSLLYLRRKNIYNHFRNTLKTQQKSNKHL